MGAEEWWDGVVEFWAGVLRRYWKGIFGAVAVWVCSVLLNAVYMGDVLEGAAAAMVLAVAEVVYFIGDIVRDVAKTMNVFVIRVS
jgi:hypothetical protein